MSESLPWRSERPLDAARVARIVDAQFPALAPARAVFLGEGWDSETYTVNGDWVLRFPKREDVVASQNVERTMLPRLAPLLPVPIPAPALFGEPCAEFPFRFLGYRRLEGVPVLHVAPDAVDAAALARHLAAFVSGLHAVPVAEARALGVPEHPRRDPVVSRDRHAEVWRGAREAVPAALLARGDAYFAAAPPPAVAFPLRLVHGDVTYDHVLLRPDGGDVAGIIDWGDLSIADPAWDFAGMLAWYGEAFARRMIEDYGVSADPGLLERARRGAVYGSATAVWWGALGGRPQDVAAGTRGLALSLPPA